MVEGEINPFRKLFEAMPEATRQRLLTLTMRSHRVDEDKALRTIDGFIRIRVAGLTGKAKVEAVSALPSTLEKDIPMGSPLNLNSR